MKNEIRHKVRLALQEGIVNSDKVSFCNKMSVPSDWFKGDKNSYEEVIKFLFEPE